MSMSLLKASTQKVTVEVQLSSTQVGKKERKQHPPKLKLSKMFNFQVSVPFFYFDGNNEKATTDLEALKRT